MNLILVSSDIKSCIFGIYSENKFEEAKRSNNNSPILFKTNSGQIFKLTMYRQKEFAGAFVKVNACSSYKQKQQRFHENVTRPVSKANKFAD